MPEYQSKLRDIVRTHGPMERLKAFQKQCQGLFAPLDLPPPTGALTTAQLDDESAFLPPLNASLESRSGGVGSGRLYIPGGLAPMVEESREPQRIDSVPGSTPQPAEGHRQEGTVAFVLLALAWVSGMYL